ncbi:MAG TPA: condensation domain-containing protein, partial [Thermoanaerobaculia bacterium]|nr:condensation domain-containing protein [Thermoanaerobaculia bacterium]
MSASELLYRLRGLGVEVWSEGETLRLNAPVGVLTPALRAELSQRKAEILGFLGRAARSAAEPAATPPPIVRVPRQGRLPLSFAQQRLWFLEQLQPGSPVYHVPAAFRLEGELCVPALAAAFSTAVARHEALRTLFPSLDGEPAQVIVPPFPVELPVVDLGAAGEVERWTRELARRPFDLARGPLYRCALLRLSERESVFVLVLHHIVSDGWSVEILLRELTALYRAARTSIPAALPGLPVQYADFACWQRRWLAGEVLDAQLAWWRERLTGMPPVLELAPDRPRPPVQASRGGTRSLRLPAEIAAELAALSRRAGATLFMTLLAGFEALLARRSGREDLTVGTPVAGRGRVETEGLVGLFANTLVIRGDLSGDPLFHEHLARVRERTLEAFRHQDIPFEKLVEELRPERSLSHSPLFQVMLSLQSFPAAVDDGGSGLRIRRAGVQAGNAKFDLHLSLAESAGRLNGGFEYDRALFDAATVERMAGHLATLLAAVAARPGMRLSEVPLLPDCERHQLLLEWNDRPGVPGQGGLLHERFEAQAERIPDAVALVCGPQRLSYGELDERASRAAARLRVGPEDIVVLEAGRSPEMVIELLGILKAGAAWLPIDPRQPRARLEALPPRPPLPPPRPPPPG